VVADSSDSGATWTTNQVALPTPVPYVDVSLSGDGKHWAPATAHSCTVHASRRGSVAGVVFADSS
jgi:hypothetical protein